MRKRLVAVEASGVKHEDFYFISSDGYRLYGQTWKPEGNIRGLIFLVHGLGEHTGRYNLWCEKLSSEHFIVSAFDLRGHGLSEGRKGLIKEYYSVITDIQDFISNNTKKYPSLPVILYGHSLGGNLALKVAVNNQVQLNALIVTSPWLTLANPPHNFVILGINLLSKILPKKLIANGLNPGDLSRDLRIVNEYKKDPLVHDKINLKFFMQTHESGMQLSRSIYKINAPLLIMHGDADKITSHITTRNFVQNSSNKTTYIEWEGGFHELHNDIEKDKVYGQIVQWLDKNSF